MIAMVRSAAILEKALMVAVSTDVRMGSMSAVMFRARKCWQ